MSRAFVKDADEGPQEPVRAPRVRREIPAEFQRGAGGATDDRVLLGASVSVREPNGSERRYRIVDEEAANPAAGAVAWTAPLAQALLGKRAGDRVLWRRPAGDLPLTIVGIVYDS